MNGSPFQTIMTIKSGGQNQSVALNLAPWNTYRLRVRATDNLGAVGDWATGPAFTISLYEESSASIGFSGGWPTAALSGAYGGSVRHADTIGSNATFTFTGSSVTLVSTRGPSRGKAEIWLDGVKKQTVDLYVSGSQTPRRVVFTASGLNPNAAHTLEIKVLGAKHQNSSSKRFDVDAIVVVQ
jgi:bacillopeptidase F